MSERLTTGNGAVASGTADEGFGPYLALLRRRRLVLAFVPLGLAFVTAVALYLSPREYLAEASFVAQEPQSGAMSKLGSLASSLTGGMGGLLGGMSPALGPTSSADFYGSLLRSRELIHDVVITQYRSSRPKGFSGDLVKYLEIDRPTRAESEIAAIKPTRNRLTGVYIELRTGIVTISATTKDPDLSLQITRRMLDLVNEFNVQRLQSQAGAEREFTDHRSKEARDDLEKAEQALAAFDERNRSVVASPSLQLERAGLQRRIEIAEQVYLVLVQQFEEARIMAVRNTPLIAVVSNPEGLVEPVRKGIPEKMVIVALGTLFLGSLIVLVVDRKHMRRADDDSRTGRRATAESTSLAAD